jgi:S1-C subfamily serine protease
MDLRRLFLVSSLTILAVSTMTAQGWSSQGGQRMMRFDANTSVLLREIMTMVAEDNGKLTIMMVPPSERRPEGMPEVDLQRGDEVGMAKGKRVSSIKELRAAYEGTKPGEEFKLGIRRDGKAIVVAFSRKDDKDMPSGGGQMVVRREAGDENSDVFPALGLMLEKKEAGVVVAETMPHASKEFKKGDVISTLNGTPIKNVADFAKALDATTVGDQLNLELLRGSDPVKVSFPRPEPRMMIQNEKKD